MKVSTEKLSPNLLLLKAVSLILLLLKAVSLHFKAVLHGGYDLWLWLVLMLWRVSQNLR